MDSVLKKSFISVTLLALMCLCASADALEPVGKLPLPLGEGRGEEEESGAAGPLTLTLSPEARERGIGFSDRSSGGSLPGESSLLSLEDAYRLAIKTHESIQIAEREIKKSSLLPKMANSLMLPRAALYGNYKRLSEPIEFEPTVGNFQLEPIQTIPEEQTVGDAEIVQPVLQPSYFPRRMQARQSIGVSTQQYYQVIQDILYQVALAYHQVLEAKELGQNAEEILTLAEEELQVAKARFKAGNVTEDTVVRAELGIMSARRKLIQSRNRITLAKEVLGRLVGIDERRFDVVEPPHPKEPGEDLKTLESRALANRHDYLGLLRKVEVAKSGVDLAKAKFLPTVDLSWDYYAVDDPAFNQNDDYWLFAVDLKVPLLEGGSRFWELQEKKETLAQARLGCEDMRKTVRIEVQEAILAVQENRDLLEHTRKQLELAKLNYDIIFAKFKFGNATSLDLDEALATLDSTKTQLIVDKYGFQTAVLGLQKAVGLFASDQIDMNR